MKRKGTFWIWLGILLVLAALSLACYNIWDEARADKLRMDLLGQIQQKTVDTGEFKGIYKQYEEYIVNLITNKKILGTPYFNYKNYSVPKNDPIHNAPFHHQLKAAIRNQMQPASCVLVLAGVYSTYSRWINIELELAKEMGKKIIAIEPWGAERTSAIVKNSADKIVKWQSSSIISAIRGY